MPGSNIENAVPPTPSSPVRITTETEPNLCLAMQQNAIPILRKIVIENISNKAIEDIAFTISSDPALITQEPVLISTIAPGEKWISPPTELALSSDKLRAQMETETGLLTVTVTDNSGALGSHSTPLSILPPAHWPGLVSLPELLAAYVTPNHPALQAVLEAASDFLKTQTGSGALDGYQSRDPKRVAQMCQAVYEALRATGVRYINPPASFEKHGQRVRFADEVIGKMGTCLDVALVLASLLEQAGLNTFIVLMEQHAFTGVWLTRFHLHSPTLDDPAPLRSRTDLKEALVFDSTVLTAGGSFEQARTIGRGYLDDTPEFDSAIDIRASRLHGIRPLSLTDTQRQQPLILAPEESQATLNPFADIPTTSVKHEPTTEHDRLKRWKDRLLDLTLRNRLLNFKETKRTILLQTVEPARLEDALHERKSFAIHPKGDLLPNDPRDPNLFDNAVVEQNRWLQSEQNACRLHTDLTEAELAKRMLEIYRQTATAFQESGAISCYLAIGLLRWFETDSSNTPRLAPLLLVPITILRNKGSAFEICGAEDETRVNVTLLKKLDTDFGISTRAFDTLPEDGSGVDVQEIFRRFRTLVRDKPRWEVLESVHLARFSFTKFLMWLDLEAKTDVLLENEVVHHLFNGKGKTYLNEMDWLPPDRVDERAAEQVLTVLDADPTQLSAIFAAEAGANFVLQGPPGTGKSQTITNMIAQLLATGKTVLFVSEKMAALEVVQRRLDAVGLGPFCLELHSHKASKRGVLDQLQQTLDTTAVHSEDAWRTHAAKLSKVRDELNEFATLLATRTPLGPTCFEVASALIGLKDAPKIQVDTSEFSGCDAAQLEQLHAAVHRMETAVRRTGPLRNHPWRPVRQSRWTPGWHDQVETSLADLIKKATTAQEATGQVANALGLSTFETSPQALEALQALLTSLLETPKPGDALVYPNDPASHQDTVAEWQHQLKTFQHCQTETETLFRPSLFQANLPALLHQFQRWANSFFLIAFVMLWSARSQLKAHAKGALPSNRAIRNLLQNAQNAQAAEAVLQQAKPEAKQLFATHWKGPATDPDHVQAIQEWAIRFHAAVLATCPDFNDVNTPRQLAVLATARADQLSPSAELGGHILRAQRALSSFSAAKDALWEALDIAPDTPWSRSLTLETLLSTARQWQSSLGALRDWCEVQHATKEMHALHLGALVQALSKGEISASELTPALERAVYTCFWNQYVENEPRLLHFRGWKHEEIVRTFQQLDKQAMGLASQVIRSRLHGAVPSLRDPGSEPPILRRQLQLKRRHLPIRKLFTSIPTLLRAMKPCVLMSPLSVAQYLDPSLTGFDVVIFDEASQIPPWDAVGAIARGSQVIIVGDSKQLPPTTFFSRGVDQDDILDDEDMTEVDSILEEAVASGIEQLALGWHYRSRHESLITFSNHYYYEGRLNTFPSAAHQGEELGVEYRPVPHGFYDRGASRTNRAEAEAVVAEIFRRMRAPGGRRPSIGVVTFSMPQQRLIEDLVDITLQSNQDLEALFRPETEEYTFIKNLENVQGDERDVMLFSIGYGPDRAGKVTMNFGPLNRAGGERRLNVAITRAREKTIVFATVRPEQIDLRRTRAIGVAHLRTYLAYAQKGVAAIDAAITEIGGETESPFEAQVQRLLQKNGWVVHSQVGCSGYRIDLAVLDPENPGRYLLGIECDGASYHSSRCARERDRLRQTVLEGLGWRIHRIWSTDWWTDPTSEWEKLHSHLQQVQTMGPQVPTVQAPEPLSLTPAPPGEEVAEEEDTYEQVLSTYTNSAVYAVLPYTDLGTQEEFHEATSVPALAKRLKEVVDTQGPIHIDEAFRDVAKCWNFNTLGRKMKRQLTYALSQINAAQRPVTRGDVWLWPSQTDPSNYPLFRIPSEEARSFRKAEHIPPEEFAIAARAILTRAIGSMQRDDLARATAHLFGIRRMGPRVREHVGAGVAHLDNSDDVDVRGEELSLK